MGLKDHTIFEEPIIESEIYNVTHSFDEWLKMIEENPELDLKLNREIGSKFNKFLLGPTAKIGAKTLAVYSIKLDGFDAFETYYLLSATVIKDIENNVYIKIRVARND